MTRTVTFTINEDSQNQSTSFEITTKGVSEAEILGIIEIIRVSLVSKLATKISDPKRVG